MIALLLALVLASSLPLLAQPSAAYMADALAGPIVPPPGEGPDARQALLLLPKAIAVDSAGNVFILDERLNRVLKVTASGSYRLAAGSGQYSSANTDLAAPSDLAIDKQDNIYIADHYRSRIVKVSAAGVFSVIAGGGTNSGDGFPAAETKLGFVDRVAVDSQGNVYFAEDRANRIRRIAVSSGRIETVAGTGSTTVGVVNGMVCDDAGNLYFLDDYGSKVRKRATDGTVSLVLSTSSLPWKNNAPVKANFLFSGIALDASGTLYLANEYDPLVLKCPAAKDCEMIAGGGGNTTYPVLRGFNGDGPVTSDRKLSMIKGMVRDAQGNIYLAEQHRVRRISAGQISTIAGTPAPEAFNGGLDASKLIVTSADGLVRDAQGNIFFSDFQNARVWKIGADKRAVAYAGTGVDGYSGDGGPATSAEIDTPGDLAVDPSGNLYINDYQNHVVRKVDSAGRISTVAGTFRGTRFSCDSAVTTAARATDICATGLGRIAADSAGFVFSSYPNLWRVNADGSARNLPIPSKYVNTLEFDSQGTLYLGSSDPARIWKGNAAGGAWSVIAGNGTQGFSGDGGKAVDARIDPLGIAVDANGYIFFGNQTGGPRLRYITPDGMINSISGSKLMGTAAMGAPASDVRITPNSIALANGVLYMTDSLTSSNVLSNVSAWSFAPAQIFRTGVVNAASYAGGSIAPGEIVTIYGVGIGPPNLALYQVSNGRFATELEKTRVMVNGVAAPLIYVSSSQVSAVMPFNLSAGTPAEVWLEFQGKATNRLQMPVLPAFAGIFTALSNGSGQAAVQHWPDYSLNGAGNPIARGGVGMIYLTSGGGAGKDGELAAAAESLTLPVEVRLGSVTAAVLYAGTSPGIIYGMTQVNFIVPESAPTGSAVPLYVKIGERWAQATTTIAVK